MASTSAEPSIYKHIAGITLNFDTATVNDIQHVLYKYGVCVVDNVVPESDCEHLASEAVASLERLGEGANRDNPVKFGVENTVPQTRFGMYQACFSNNAAVNWVVRCHPNVIRTFEAAYAKGVESHVSTYLASSDKIENAPSDLMVSGDGMTVLPNKKYRPCDDWAHLDQMHTKLFYKEEQVNYQGQIGLTNCNHAFRVSVGSHKVHEDVVSLVKKSGKYPQKMADSLAKKKSPSGFLKLNPDDVTDIRDIVENKNPAVNHYQCLIPGKIGTLILWDARCIHSAYRNPEPLTDTAHALDGWRCVIYVSFRRKAFMSNDEKLLRAKALLLNDTTSHWGQSKMTTRQRGKLPPKTQRLFSNPCLMYSEIYKPPELSEQIKQLSCLNDAVEIEPEIYGKAIKLYNTEQFEQLKEQLRPQRRKATKQKHAGNRESLRAAIKKMKK